MKKVLFLVAFFSLASMVSVSAQTKTTPDAQKLTAAIKAAKNDPSIIQKVGADGQITFKQKSVCSESGRVSYKPVQYNAESKSWTAVKGGKSCSGKAAGKACCSSKKGKSCSGKKGKSCSGKAKKSCGSKAKKSCGNGKCGDGKCGG